MTPKEFAAILMKSIVEENTETYQDIFASTSPEGASDPYWKRALALYRDLSADQRPILFEIMRQVAVDTTSNFLGAIDGVNSLEGAAEKFTLLYGRDQKLSGDLQSLFLSEEERQAR